MRIGLTRHCAERGDIKRATAYFEAPLRQGSPFEAYYYLADIQARQARAAMVPPEIASSSCSSCATIAVSFYKLVAERGTWDDNLLKDGDDPWNLNTESGSEMAMFRWWIAAERGYEVAQSNLAYVLEGISWVYWCEARLIYDNCPLHPFSSLLSVTTLTFWEGDEDARSYYDHPEAREIDGRRENGQPALEEGEELDDGLMGRGTWARQGGGGVQQAQAWT
ncbi:hypothetical protein OH77DRAFT_546553 [Trametes cingulata]|nr:hypothetical protein OH77DRAFT_546553 [Trametes cingulata]